MAKPVLVLVETLSALAWCGTLLYVHAAGMQLYGAHGSIPSVGFLMHRAQKWDGKLAKHVPIIQTCSARSGLENLL